MLKEKVVSDDVVKRAWRKVDEIAKSKGITRKEFINWSDKENYKTNISQGECNLIFAYQVNEAIKRLDKGGYGPRAMAAYEENRWIIDKLRDDFYNIGKAMRHLTEVCGYIRDKYNTSYKYEWLLEYDDTLYSRAINEGSKGRSKPKKDY